jgi:hypothetical protein
MRSSRVGKAILVAVACLILFPLAASAQSAFTGLVRDESGGVLPGVTVEAASPVLIEKVRTGVTDDQGRYRIVDLRPGTYTLTFTLTGFSTLVRDGLTLASNFTATVNADLKVGSLQESVTVSGAAPVVDVQQASRTQVLTRDLVDALPTSRNIMSVGAVVPGLRMGTPDVGGSRSMEQPSMRGHGANNTHNSQLSDGLMINSIESGGASWQYVDDALIAETSVMTSAIPADTATGGMRLNLIPKDGGNVVTGAVFLGGSNGTWQSKNVDDKLRARGIGKANASAHVQNFNGALGGPVKKDALWFFISARHNSQDEIVANVPPEIVLPDGTYIRAILDQFIRDGVARLTWQISPRNKFAGWFQRSFKHKGKDFSYGADPRFASNRDNPHAHQAFGQLRWATTWSSKILLEGGYSTSSMSHSSGSVVMTAPLLPAFTPGWYQHTVKTDTALNTSGYYQTCAFTIGCLNWDGGNTAQQENWRRVIGGSASYVTGTHNIKVGFQDSFGPFADYSWRNGDIQLNYVNNSPSTVSVYNTPTAAKYYINGDIGLYAQDSWTIKRLTVNPGVRVNWFKSQMVASVQPAGRFVPARYFDAQPNLPNWGPDWGPRLSAAYDLFGDGKTAIKASASKYYQPFTNNYANRYANAVVSTDSRAWFDADLIPGTSTVSGVALATNKDGIAQENEIGPSSTTTFGLRSDRNPAPGEKWPSNWEITTSVQHQIVSNVSVSAAYFHRFYQNLEVTDRGQIATADYTSFTLPMPDFSRDATLSGVLAANEIITVYNLSTAKRGVYNSSQVDYNSTGQFGNQGPDQSIYNGFEVSFSARLARTTIFGGWTMEHNVSTFCDTNDNPNGATTSDLYEGNTVARGGRFCDQSQFSMPFRHEFKLSGNYPLPYGVDFAAVLQAYPGVPRAITWQPAASLFPGGARTNSETILLSRPGTLFLPRYTQLDVNFRKNFRAGRKRFSLQVDLFNALNGNAIWSTNNAIGSSLGNVQSILPGRLPRLAFQMQF